MAKRTPITVGVAGLGRAGWNIHVNAIRPRKDFVLTDVVDVNEERLAEAKKEFGCATYTNWKEFVKKCQAELVIVATQSCDHAPMSIDALRAGKHVMTEKPMALNARQADRMIAARDKSGKILTVHQQRHIAPDTLHIHEVIKSRKLGRIFMVKRNACGFSRRTDWQTLKKYGGGALNNTGIHMMEQIGQLLDSPVKEVFGDLQQIVNPGDVEDHVKIVLKTERGLVVDVQISSAHAAPAWAWVLLGSRGSLWSDGKTSHLKYFKAGTLKKLKPIDGPQAAERKYGIGETIPWIEEEMPTASKKKINFYDELYKSIRLGKPLLVAPELVREVHRIIDRARRGTGF